MAGKTKISGSDIFWHQVSMARRFCLTMPPANARLAVVSGGREKCAEGYKVDRSDFPFFCIEFVASGEGSVELRGRRYALSPGVVFSYGPGMRHVISSSNINPMVKYFIDFTGKDASRMMSRILLPPGTVRRTFDPEQAIRYFEDIIGHGYTGGRNSRQICSALLECLMLVLDEKMLPYKVAEKRSSAPTFMRIKKYISANYSRTDDIRKVASACSVDVAYLCRLFRRYERISPYQHILRLRMNDAAKVLQDPDALVKDAADRSGYSDQYQFSRAFKKVFGLSPVKYRKLISRS